MTDSIKFAAPCLLGIEGIAGDEFRRMGAQNVVPENGRVFFEGGIDILARSNIRSRYCERILINMGSFNAVTFDSLFEGTKNLPWERWIGPKDTFPVKGSSLNSKLFSVPDCQSIIKKAVVERLKTKYKINWFEETGSVRQIQFLLLKDKALLMIDTSGAGLHKRGYRKNSMEAPIKETLAAAMADIAHVNPDSAVIDPFCGSGTVLIESALKAYNIAPGMNRRFACENWSDDIMRAFLDEKEIAKALIRKDSQFSGIGYDIDKSCVALTLENAGKAGKLNIMASKKDFFTFDKIENEKAIIICNPPYGERLLDIEQARKIYGKMGKVFEKRGGLSYYIISPDEKFESCFGRPADKRRKLYNGMIKCQLYMYFRG